MAQFSRPTSDVAVNSFSTAPLWSKIDEVVANDADLIRSPNDPANQTARVGLSTVNNPNVSTGHIMRFRYRQAYSGGGSPSNLAFEMRLLQGTTLIATQTIPALANNDTAWYTNAYTLTGAEADAITDYSLLRMEFWVNKVSGAKTAWGEISWAEFEVPDVVDIEAPSQVTNVNATAGDKEVSLTWDAASDNLGVAGYEYRVDGGTPVDVGNVLTTDVTGLTNTVQYSFEVRAYDTANNFGAWSTAVNSTPTDTTPPSQVTSLDAEPGNTEVDLSWESATDNNAVTGYQYRVDSGTPVDVGLTLSTTVTSLTNDIQYSFEVRAYDAESNFGAWSSPATATPFVPRSITGIDSITGISTITF